MCDCFSAFSVACVWNDECIEALRRWGEERGCPWLPTIAHKPLRKGHVMCKRNTGLGCGKLHTSEVTKAPREKYFAFIHTSSSLTFTAASGFVSHSNLKVYSGIFQIMYLTFMTIGLDNIVLATCFYRELASQVFWVRAKSISLLQGFASSFTVL